MAQDRESKIQNEMLFTTWEESCQDPILTEDGDLRECRRFKNHNDKHASGFGSGFKEW